MPYPSRFSAIRSYPERWVGFIPIPFWCSWLIIWAVIYLVDLYLSRGGQAHNRLTELGVVVFCASVCINLGLSSGVMKNLYGDLSLFVEVPEAELETWYASKLRWMYEGFLPLIAAALFSMGVEVTLGQTINEFNRSSEALFYFRMFYRMFGFFMLGASLWATINYMRLPSQLLRFKFRMRLTNLSGIGLRALGGAFFTIALLGISSFVFLVATILVSPLSDSQVVIVWVSLGAVLIFCLFLLPQVGVHRAMSVEKRQQLISFSNHMDEALARSMKDPSPENMQRLKEMFELQNYLRDLNVWPFDTSTLWQLISALLIPLLLVIIQIMFRL